MHTIMVIGGGLALLAAMLILVRLTGMASLSKAALAFIPVWLAAAVVNLSVGVLKAGYTVAQEFPIMLVVFGIPAAVAVGVRRFVKR